MASNRTAQLLFVILFNVLFMLNACERGSNDSTGNDNQKKPILNSTQINEPYPVADLSLNENSNTDVEWGVEVNLDKMIAMAKKGQIEEIDWHVMPNILLAKAGDGRIFHLKNENKGVDLRDKLIKAGVKIGDRGILFKHVF